MTKTQTMLAISTGENSFSMPSAKEQVEKEAEQLARYRSGHGGKNPKYNETDEG